MVSLLIRVFTGKHWPYPWATSLLNEKVVDNCSHESDFMWFQITRDLTSVTNHTSRCKLLCPQRNPPKSGEIALWPNTRVVQWGARLRGATRRSSRASSGQVQTSEEKKLGPNTGGVSAKTHNTGGYLGINPGIESKNPINPGIWTPIFFWWINPRNVDLPWWRTAVSARCASLPCAQYYASQKQNGFNNESQWYNIVLTYIFQFTDRL